MISFCTEVSRRRYFATQGTWILSWYHTAVTDLSPWLVKSSWRTYILGLRASGFSCHEACEARRKRRKNHQLIKVPVIFFMTHVRSILYDRSRLCLGESYHFHNSKSGLWTPLILILFSAQTVRIYNLDTRIALGHSVIDLISEGHLTCEGRFHEFE